MSHVETLEEHEIVQKILDDHESRLLALERRLVSVAHDEKKDEQGADDNTD